MLKKRRIAFDWIFSIKIIFSEISKKGIAFRFGIWYIFIVNEIRVTERRIQKLINTDI